MIKVFPFFFLPLARLFPKQFTETLNGTVGADVIIDSRGNKIVEQILLWPIRHSKSRVVNARHNKISHGWSYYSQHKTIISIEIYQIPESKKDAFNSLTINSGARDPSPRRFTTFLLHVCSTIKIYNILLLNIMMIQKICYFMCLLRFLFAVSCSPRTSSSRFGV